jgi:hypothetical protein
MAIFSILRFISIEKKTNNDRGRITVSLFFFSFTFSRILISTIHASYLNSIMLFIMSYFSRLTLRYFGGIRGFTGKISISTYAFQLCDEWRSMESKSSGFAF